MTRYEHTQYSPLGPAFAVAALGCLAFAFFGADHVVRNIAFGMAAVAGLFAAMLARLSFREEPDHLNVRFGPLPWGGTRVRYDRIRSVARARSSWIDGWGIHWVPRRGWTFNLWGFDCVEIETERGRVRIGTDDPDGLAQHLLQRSARTASAVAE